MIREEFFELMASEEYKQILREQQEKGAIIITPEGDYIDSFGTKYAKEELKKMICKSEKDER